MITQRLLWRFIQAGNLNKLKTILENPNEDSSIVYERHKPSGDSVVHMAARCGFLKLLEYFHEVWKVGLELRNLDDKMPLHDAAANGHADVAEYLLRHEVPVDWLKKGDWTPLMMACTKKNNIGIIQVFIKAGADLHLVNKDGWSCFHIACRTGDCDLINFLLEIDGALWDSFSRNGRTPLHTVSLHGHTALLEILIQKCSYNLDVQDTCGNTPLMDAVRAGHLETVKCLINNGAEVNIYDKLGRNVLHIAAECNQTKVIEYLVTECKMNPRGLTTENLFCKSGKSPLDWASKENQEEAIAILNKLCEGWSS